MISKIFNKALKSSWVKKYLDPENQGKWKLLFDYELQNLGGVEFFRTNLNKQDLLKTIKTAKAFTSEILHIWSEISLETNVSSIDQLKAQSLWHNSLIRVGNKPVYYRSWSVKGVKTVGHLMNDANSFLSFSDFKELYDTKTNFLMPLFKASHQLLRPYKKAMKLTSTAVILHTKLPSTPS